MYGSAAEVTVHRLELRGAEAELQRSRSAVQTALEQGRWPTAAPGEYLIVRRIESSGTPREIAARAAQEAGRAAAGTIDGWSAAAADAAAVRFRSHASMVACLIRDLLSGAASSRWFWRRWGKALRLPLQEGMAALLQERPLECPEVLARLRPTPVWGDFWRELGAAGAERLVSGVALAAGWGEAVRAARPPAVAVEQERSGDIPAAAVCRDLLCPPLRLERDDPRALLAALVTVWSGAPALLATRAAGPLLRRLAELAAAGPPRPQAAARSEDGLPSQRPPLPPGPEADLQWQRRSVPPQPAQQGPAAEHGGAAPEAALWQGARPAPGQDSPPVPAKDSAGSGTAAQPAALRPPPGGEAGGDLSGTAVRPPGPDADSPGTALGAAAAERIPPAPPIAFPEDQARPLPPSRSWQPLGEREFLTGQGGLFYLLNFLNLPAVRSKLPADLPGAGWRSLFDLAAALHCPPEGELLEYLAAECGLSNGAELALLPPLPSSASLFRLGARRYGDEVWRAGSFRVAARLIAGPTHVDLHFRLNDARVEVRRPGLDLNPGWLPWLGRVVTFHYGSGLEPPR